MLSLKHIEKLSMLNKEVIEGRGYATIEEGPILAHYGFKNLKQQRTPTLLIPHYDIWGQNGYSQHRPDEPRRTRSGIVKYETPEGKPHIIDYHPLQDTEWLQNQNKTLWIVEGVLKGDALISRFRDKNVHQPVIGIDGVWGWGKNNKLNHAFNDIKVAGRSIILIPDGDVRNNDDIKSAMARLKGQLKRRRAREVIVVLLPTDNPKDGLDDLFKGKFSLSQLFEQVRIQKETIFQQAILKLSTKLDYPKMGNLFAKTHINYCYGLGVWREWCQGYWCSISDDDFAERVHNHLMENKYLGMSYTKKNLGEVINYLKYELYIDTDIWDTEEHLLPVQNGLVNTTTFELEPHDRSVYFSSGFNFRWVEGATSKDWDKILLNPNLTEEEIEFLQEYVGYCLTTDTSHDILLIITGVMNTGKSTFVESILAMMGDRGTELSLDMLQRDKYAIGKIVGKTLAVSTELKNIRFTALDMVNRIVSGETVTIRNMRKDPFDYVSKCKMLYSMHNPPKTFDPQNGFYRRVKIIKFDTPLTRNDEDRKIGKRLEDPHNKEAIFNWAIEGLKRLLDRGHFIIPQKILENTEEYQMENDTIGIFLDEVTIEVGGWIKPKFLYELYTFWMDVTGHQKPKTYGNFRDEVTTRYRLGRHQQGNRNIKAVFHGVSLNESFLDDYPLRKDIFLPAHKNISYGKYE